MSRGRRARRRFALGKNAVAECQRSGQKMRYLDLVEDGHVPALLVHPDWYEPRHPQELPVSTDDAQALYWPAAELSIPDGEFEDFDRWAADVISDCPPNPLNLRFFESSTLANPVNTGDFFLTLNDRVSYGIRICLYVELDGGGWHINKTAINTYRDYRTDVVPILVPYNGGPASAGNDVFIGIAGSRDPLLDFEWSVGGV